ncbi:DMT family transporter [Candidatus Gromoviella agglomerans]|uniref:DMT family transporter n=1 Tax=Candidatus Gromoviella agglomerans TaxID=2806609 RepID=UPI001E3DD525|nr:DMT family transporter [Candidatus Gromoviella agglomerans]UFX98432.1 DMT family transporter [Candidatus Gromoviella agglomerans]
MNKVALVSKILSSTIYAINNAFTKFISTNGVNNLVFIDTLLCTITTIITIKIKKLSFKTNFFKYHFLRGIVYAFATMMWFSSLKNLPIGVVTTIGASSPIWTILGSIIFLNEKFTKIKFLAVILGIVGSIIMIYEKMAFSISIDIYLFMPILANIAYAACNILARKVKTEDEYITTFYQLFFALPIIAIFFGVNLSVLCEFNCIALAILCQSIMRTISYILSTRAIKYAEVISLIPIGMIRPFIGYIIGISLFHEAISMNQVIGTITILMSVLIGAKIKE